MSIDHKTAVNNASNATADAKKNGAGPKSSGGKKSGISIWVWVAGIGFLALLIGVIVFAISSTGRSNQEEIPQGQQAVTDVTQTASAQQGNVVYSDAERNSDISSPQAQVDYSKELIYFTDPSTGMQMVETPNGPLLVGSAEGQAYILDYENKRKAWLAANPQNGQPQNGAVNQQQEQVSAELQSANARISALEQDKVNLQNQLDQQAAYTSKQTQTIANLTNKLTQMQPVFAYAENNAKPKQTVVLKGKNRNIDAIAVQGDMAWLDVNGKVVAVRSGDTIPGTNTKVRQVDSLNNKVLVSK